MKNWTKRMGTGFLAMVLALGMLGSPENVRAASLNAEESIEAAETELEVQELAVSMEEYETEETELGETEAEETVSETEAVETEALPETEEETVALPREELIEETDPQEVQETEEVIDLAEVFGEDVCEECLEASKHVAADCELEDDFELTASGYAALMSDGELDLAAAQDNNDGIYSMLYDANTSEGQRNMVKRAYQMHLIQWTPLADIPCWGYGNAQSYFIAKTTYTGLPYGQPGSHNGYVPWDCSLEKFVDAVDTAGSLMYTSYTANKVRAPYYATDCSGFVSWAWQTPYRCYTGSIGSYANVVTPKSIYSLQIGDALNNAGSHVVMISDIGYRGDTLVYIDVIEQTPPSTKLTRYGEGGKYTLEKFESKYFSNYVILRKIGRENVTYTPSKYVTVEDETAGEIEFKVEKLKLDIGATYTLDYTMEEPSDYYRSWGSSDPSIATVKDGVITALKPGKATITLRIGPSKASVAVEVVPEAVELTSAYGNAEGTIKLAWKAVDNASYYMVYRKNSAGTWVRIKNVTGATSYTDTGADLTGKQLQKNTKYTYTVRAVCESDGSSIIGHYDKSGISATTCTETPVLAGVVASSYNSQTLVWKETAGATAYRVYRKLPTATKWTFIGETTETSYLNENLVCGTNYSYTVIAYFVENKKKIYSDYDRTGVTRMCCPATPAAPAIKTVDLSTQKVSWKAVDGADGYNVYCKTGSDTKWVQIGTTAKTYYVNKNLKAGTKYTYTIRAYRNVDGKPVLSGYNRTGTSKVCCPVTPVLKSLTTAGIGIQKLTWSEVPGAEGYVVYRKGPKDTKWVELGEVKGKAYCSIKNLTIGSTYTYTVRAFVMVGTTRVRSDYNTKGLTRMATFPEVTLKKVEAIDSTTQKVSWEAMEGATGYNVYCKAEGTTKWILLGNTADVTYTNEGLTAGTKYTYTVRATVEKDGKTILGEYDHTGITGTACPKSPVLKSIAATSYTSQTITWEAVSDADGYYIYTRIGKDSKWTYLAAVTDTSYRALGLKCGTAYSYTVRAYKLADGKKVFSGYDTTGITKTCIPATPSLESTEVTGKGKITVSWNGVSGAHGYTVYRKTASTKWVELGTTKSLNYTDSNLKAGETYIYTVRAVRVVDEKSILSGYKTAGIKCTLSLGKTEVTSAKWDSSGNVAVSWNKVDFADGYIIYCKEPGGKWSLSGRVANGKATSVVLTTLDANKEYLVCIRAFWKNADGSEYRGPYDSEGITVE